MYVYNVNTEVDWLILFCVQLDTVRSEYVQLSILYHRLMSATDIDEQRELRNSLLQLLQVFILSSLSTDTYLTSNTSSIMPLPLFI